MTTLSLADVFQSPKGVWRCLKLRLMRNEMVHILTVICEIH